MEGSIWVESQLNVGSKFHFTIQADYSPEECVSPVLSSPILENKRACFVLPNATQRHIVFQYTSSWGLQVTETPYWEQAKAWINKGTQYDLLLLDHNCDPDVFEVAKNISMQKNSPKRILVLGPIKERQTTSSVHAYLTKPLKKQQLFDMLCLLLNPAYNDDEKHQQPELEAINPDEQK